MPKNAVAKSEQERILPAAAHDVYRGYLHGKTLAALAREYALDPRTVKKYVDALLKEHTPARTATRERLRSEALAKLRQIHQHAWSLVEADPENTAALNVVVRAIREESKLQGLYANDVSVNVEHSGAVEIHVVYKNNWRDAGPNVGPATAVTAAQPTIIEAVVVEGQAG